MRPGGHYDRTSYRDSRPGRHATRATVLADALGEAADEIDDLPAADQSLGAFAIPHELDGAPDER
ncbi:hypothetical protein ACG83_11055 [Frankia sp. R43]|uniref:hypothetical protein n=1 Tax=Frankia sp. R43 TaxID=269536 RepID=UPI0006CA539B|nr:hypothetical protein [Frankia sp. R43]KPM55802.1 hypothetical protein ACG83_11055 [Frankia sp. R43]